MHKFGELAKKMEKVKESMKKKRLGSTNTSVYVHAKDGFFVAQLHSNAIDQRTGKYKEIGVRVFVPHSQSVQTLASLQASAAGYFRSLPESDDRSLPDNCTVEIFRSSKGPTCAAASQILTDSGKPVSVLNLRIIEKINQLYISDEDLPQVLIPTKVRRFAAPIQSEQKEEDLPGPSSRQPLPPPSLSVASMLTLGKEISAQRPTISMKVMAFCLNTKDYITLNKAKTSHSQSM